MCFSYVRFLKGLSADDPYSLLVTFTAFHLHHKIIFVIINLMYDCYYFYNNHISLIYFIIAFYFYCVNLFYVDFANLYLYSNNYFYIRLIILNSA